MSMPPKFAILCIAAACWGAALPQSDSVSAKRKLAAIQQGRLAPGSSVTFTPREIDAWSRVEIPKQIPRGFREPHVQLGEGVASGHALVDFLQMRQAQGQTPGWLMSRMLEGERPLLMSIRLRSSGGRCTVDLTRVEISGVAAQGSVLDFLIRTFFLPLYPNAKIGEPFALGFNIDRVEIHPAGVVVRIGKASEATSAAAKERQ
jgi:hypothetical protein